MSVSVGMDSTLYFMSFDYQSGERLWKSDGTLQGTKTIRGFLPGPADEGTYYGSFNFTAIGPNLFLAGNDVVNGCEPWMSDGTTSATVMLGDINPGPNSCDPQGFGQVGSAVCFFADDGVHGRELWKADLKNGRTLLVKDIRAGAESSVPGGPYSGVEIKTIGSTAFFGADDGVHSGELWKTDGTESGTVLVRDAYPNGYSSRPNHLTVVGSTLYYLHGGLWRSDGTASGTMMVKSLYDDYTEQIVTMDSVLYFRGSGQEGLGLWRSDGTTSGTYLVKAFHSVSQSIFPQQITVSGSKLFFVADDSVHGSELWRSDGTEAGTVMVKDIVLGSGGIYCWCIAAVGRYVYFNANDGIHGRELWRSDGTERGTVMVDDIWPGAEDSNPHSFTVVGSTLFFSADNGLWGSELWKIVHKPNPTGESGIWPQYP